MRATDTWTSPSTFSTHTIRAYSYVPHILTHHSHTSYIRLAEANNTITREEMQTMRKLVADQCMSLMKKCEDEETRSRTSSTDDNMMMVRMMTRTRGAASAAQHIPRCNSYLHHSTATTTSWRELTGQTHIAISEHCNGAKQRSVFVVK